MYWDSGWLSKYLPCEQFIERYEHLHRSNTTLASQSQAKKRTTTTKKGQRRNVDDTASENSDTGGDLVDRMRPWLAEWNLYVNTNETIAKEMKIVQWWGVRLVYLTFKNLQCTKFLSSLMLIDIPHGHLSHETT
jgi:hypothetical protein